MRVVPGNKPKERRASPHMQYIPDARTYLQIRPKQLEALAAQSMVQTLAPPMSRQNPPTPASVQAPEASRWQPQSESTAVPAASLQGLSFTMSSNASQVPAVVGNPQYESDAAPDVLTVNRMETLMSLEKGVVQPLLTFSRQ